MLIFQVSSRSVQLAAPPKKKPRRLRREWSIAIHFVLAVSGAGGLFALLTIFIHSDIRFILLPVFLSLFITSSRHYARHYTLNMILNSTPLYFLLTVCLALTALSGLVVAVNPAGGSSTTVPVAAAGG